VSLRIDIGWLVTSLLLSMRFGTATMVAPVLGPTQIPAVVRVILALAFGGFLAAALPVQQLVPTSLGQLVVAALGEVIMGLTFAFGFIVVYGATQLAGRTLDVQIGFGAANVLNPATQLISPLLGSVLGMVAIATFLSLDGHLVLVKALSISVSVIPPGSFYDSLDPAAILKYSGGVFAFALALAGPVMLMFLLSDLAMAVLARSMPQLNVFVLGFAVKIVLGLTGLALSIRLSDAVLESMFGAAFAYWDSVGGGR
jgi:flagellar biosynthetic protein FliR